LDINEKLSFSFNFFLFTFTLSGFKKWESEKMLFKRREFIKKSSQITLGLGAATILSPEILDARVQDEKIKKEIIDEKSYLSEILYTEKEIDDWLNGKAFPFSKYHPEFGWLLNNSSFEDGIDGSVSTYTYVGEDGERIMSNYAEKPCRINTYGNSFTQCHQVSDHETWQEVLAAHLQEPVRNFGIGGWSVYQAYLRMLKEEKRTPAKYIIFNIYDDDHKRNLDSWRNIRVRKHPQHIEAPLPYVKVDLKNKKMIEYPNPCPTTESLYNLCDLDKTYQLFKDDFVLKIMIAHRNSKVKNVNHSYQKMMDLIKTHGIMTEIEDGVTLSRETEALHTKTALFSTMRIIEKIEAFAMENNKKILYVLSYPAKTIAKYIEEGERFDSDLVEFMEEKDFPYIDLMKSHVADYSQYTLELKTYFDKYFIGHYNPLGNFFCAWAIKNRLTKMLDPKPFPYR
jgi:hypothetical protein